jgi:hypothetical protein
MDERFRWVRPGAAARRVASLSLIVSAFAVALTGQLGAATADGPAICPVLSLANPSPNDTLPTGHYQVSGTALIPGHATDAGAGVSRVDFFLGDRDSGGRQVGSAVPGSIPGQAASAFETLVFLPSVDQRVFTAYAMSADSGAETSVSVPIQIAGSTRPGQPTPTPVPAVRVTATSGCQPAAAAVGSPPAGSVAATPLPVVAVRPDRGPVLVLGNPSPGAVLSRGQMSVSGLAFDPAASSGSGIARVDFFLGNRDRGGRLVGTTIPGLDRPDAPRTFTATITIPDGISGEQAFTVYAIAAASGLETVVARTVFVGAAPTATPRSQ